jgi:hypothetical protein
MKSKLIFLLIISVPVLSQNAFSQCACCSSVGCGDNAGTSSSLVGKGKLLINGLWRYTNFQPIGSSLLQQYANADTLSPVYNKSHQSTFILSATYGITNRLNVSLTLPYNSVVNIQSGIPGETQPEILGTSSGISNIKASIQYVLLQRQKCAGWEMIPMIGVIAPTGDHSNVALNGDLFDDQFQPGANAWVPLLGITADKSFGKFSFHTSATYIFKNTDPAGNVDAASWNGDITGYYPLLKAGKCMMMSNMKNDSSTKMIMTMPFIALNFFAAIQAEHVGQDIIALDDGTTYMNSNTGVFRTYIAAGIVANLRQHFFIPISVAVPFYQTFDGYQVKVNWRINAGIGVLL